MNRKEYPITLSLTLGLILLGLTPLLRAEVAPDIQPLTPDNDTPLTPYQSALLDYKTGKYGEARTAIDAAEKANPGDLPTEILKARILTELGDFAGGEQVLRQFLTPNGPPEVQLALGDLLLHKRDFSEAAKFYGFVLAAKPDDSDITLKMIYARVGASDLVAAAKYASQLKPLDPDHPSYYFAKAALAQATGKTQEAENDIQTARTIYGIMVTNRYLKTYLEVFASSEKTPAPDITPPVKPAPAPSKP